MKAKLRLIERLAQTIHYDSIELTQNEKKLGRHTNMIKKTGEIKPNNHE